MANREPVRTMPKDYESSVRHFLEAGNSRRENHAVVDGKNYPLEFAGYDRDTYKHLEGCLAFGNRSGPCQCGAIDRADKWYAVKVPAQRTNPEQENT